MTTPASFAERSTAQSGATVDLARWWTAYGDPELDRLVGIALTEGLDVQTAASRVRQARIAARAARAQFLPEVQGTAGVNHVEFSKNAGFSSLAGLFGGGASGGGAPGGGGAGGGAGGGSGSGIALPGSGITTYSIGFDASWEIDLFGGTRRSVEAAVARVAAAEWSARDAGVTLSAEVADDYLQLRTLQAREAVTRAEIARLTRALQLQSETARVGLVPQGDYIRQRSGLASAEASLGPLIAEQRIQMHAIAVLLGRTPDTLIAELTPPRLLIGTPPAVPPGLPSELLRRRPDVRAAERRLAAATAEIGVAVADLYPRLSLTGMAQLISTSLASLFERDSLQLTGNASAVFPVLDFGRRRAQVSNRREDREQAYVDYQRTVLVAFRDVEDALVRLSTEQDRNAALRRGLADSERSLQAVDARYRTGLVDLSAVLQAQQSVLSGRDTLASSDGALRRDLAALYKALGGGWNPDTPPTVPARPKR